MIRDASVDGGNLAPLRAPQTKVFPGTLGRRISSMNSRNMEARGVPSPGLVWKK